MSDMVDLPPKLSVLYGLLEPGQDVHVLNLYQGVTGKETNDQRFAQQALGAYFVRLNRRLRAIKQKVEPGSLKLTYRLGRL